jgi:hypothetical protein
VLRYLLNKHTNTNNALYDRSHKQMHQGWILPLDTNAQLYPAIGMTPYQPKYDHMQQPSIYVLSLLHPNKCKYNTITLSLSIAYDNTILTRATE